MNKAPKLKLPVAEIMLPYVWNSPSWQLSRAGVKILFLSVPAAFLRGKLGKRARLYFQVISCQDRPKITSPPRLSEVVVFGNAQSQSGCQNDPGAVVAVGVSEIQYFGGMEAKFLTRNRAVLTSQGQSLPQSRLSLLKSIEEQIIRSIDDNN